MSANMSNELIRCSICNKVVPKQQYCPKCGKLLIKNYKGPAFKAKESSQEKKNQKPVEEKVDKDESSELEKLREQMKKIEDERREAIEEESKSIDLIIGEKEDLLISGDPMVKTLDSKDILIDKVEEVAINIGDGFVYTPDKYTMDTVQKLTKNVRYQSRLVKMLSEKEMNEQTFLGLYKGLADDTHKLILRRNEVIEEIDSSVDGYENIIKVAQQGMKLLDIRMAIDDASEEEYKVKSAAFKWDINNYKNKIKTDEAKSNYLRNLGALINAEELESLIDDVDDSLNLLPKINVSDETKHKINSSMNEALSLIKETNAS
jgi:hypothetical protein